MPKPTRELDPDGVPTMREELSRASRWLVLYPLAGFVSLCLGLLVLSEILTYAHQDVLNHPQAVKSTEKNTLLLADGRHVPLKFLKWAPGDHPIFRSALARGVEIEAKGNIFGLLDVRSSCGVTLQHRYVQRINLSELAAATLPECVDGKGIDPEDLAMLSESHYARTSVVDTIATYMQRWRRVFERASA
jgi:hypothetical protein